MSAPCLRALPAGRLAHGRILGLAMPLPDGLLDPLVVLRSQLFNTDLSLLSLPSESINATTRGDGALCVSLHPACLPKPSWSRDR